MMSSDSKVSIPSNLYAISCRGPSGVNTGKCNYQRELFSHPELQHEKKDDPTTATLSSVRWPFDCPTLDYYRETLLPSPSYQEESVSSSPSSWIFQAAGVFEDEFEPLCSSYSLSSVSSNEFDY